MTAQQTIVGRQKEKQIKDKNNNKRKIYL